MISSHQKSIRKEGHRLFSPLLATYDATNIDHVVLNCRPCDKKKIHPRLASYMSAQFGRYIVRRNSFIVPAEILHCKTYAVRRQNSEKYIQSYRYDCSIQNNKAPLPNLRFLPAFKTAGWISQPHRPIKKKKKKKTTSAKSPIYIYPHSVFACC